MLSLYRTRPVAAVNNGRTNLTVHDCVRLALENNLDLQTALWEENVRTQAAGSSYVRMLPRVTYDYGQSLRDRLPFSRSDVIDQEGAYEVIGPGPATGVTNFSNARERFSRTWNAGVRWSPMDACMAKYIAQMRDNDAQHAAFQRVRVAQQLTGTVTASFYRLLALTEAFRKAQALAGSRGNIARDLGKLADGGLIEKQEYLDAKALLTEAKSQVSEMWANVEKQREILATAMNVSPQSVCQLIGALEPFPATCLEPTGLESAALVNRPEAYQADLTHLTSIADQRRLIVKFFPRAEGFLGYFRDENKFLLTRYYLEGGFRVTWDLMDFAATLLDHKSASAKIVKTDRERAVISMGIMSQVRLKALEALRALDHVRRASDLQHQAAESLRIARDVEAAKDRRAQEKVMRIAREKALCRLMQMELERVIALGEYHAALADVDSAVGSNYPVQQALASHRGIDAAASLATAPLTAIQRTGSTVRRLLAWPRSGGG